MSLYSTLNLPLCLKCAGYIKSLSIDSFLSPTN